jgi:hypothetical protein
MPEANYFTTFYEQELKTPLQQLESQRLNEYKTVYGNPKKGKQIGILLSVILTLILSYTTDAGLFGLLMTLAISALFFGVIGYLIGKGKNKKRKIDLQAPFKEKIVSQIIEHLHSGVEYSPQEGITKEEVLESGLFQQELNEFRSDDLIEGKLGNATFRFAEVEMLHYKQKPNESFNKELIFNGMFLTVDFPSGFESLSYVRPKFDAELQNNAHKGKAQQIVEQRSAYAQQRCWNPEEFSDALEPLAVEANEFDRYLKVYSTAPEETRSLLNKGLRRLLISMRALEYSTSFPQWQARSATKIFQLPAVYLAVKENKIYIAKPYNRPFFDPDMRYSLIESGACRQAYDDCLMLLNVVEKISELNKEEVLEA